MPKKPIQKKMKFPKKSPKKTAKKILQTPAKTEPIDYSAKVNIPKRRELVLEMHLRGFTEAKMASVLGVSRDTVTVDKKEIRMQMAEDHEEMVKNFDPKILVQEQIQKIRRIQDRLYEGLDMQEKDRAQVARVLIEAEKEVLSNMRSIGILVPTDTEEEPLNITINRAGGPRGRAVTVTVGE